MSTAMDFFDCSLEKIADFLLLLDNERNAAKHCDFELCSGDVRMPCHGVIIRNRVRLPQLAAEEHCYHCTSLVEADALDAFLQFVYTFRVDVSMKNVQDLLQLSKELKVKELTQLCLRFIETADVNDTNWSLLSEWACEFDLSNVRRKVATYLAENFVCPQGEDAFLNLDVEMMKMVLGSDHLLVRDERNVLDAVRQWIGHQEERTQVASDLLRCVRLPMMRGLVQQQHDLITEPAFGSTECQLLLTTAVDYISHPSMRWSLQSSMTRPRLGQGLTEMLVAISPDSPADIVSLNRRAEQWHPLTSKNASQSEIHGHRSMSVLPLDPGLFLVDSESGLVHHCSNISTNYWRTFVAYIDRRSESVCVIASESIFVIGGRDIGGGQLVTSVESIDLNSEEVSKMADLPVAVLRPCLFFMQDKIYCIGGFDGQQDVTHVQVYGCRENQWTLIESGFPEGGPGMSAACFDGVVYVLGNSGKLYSFDVGSFEIRIFKDLGVACPSSSICIYRNNIAVANPQQKKLRLLQLQPTEKSIQQEIDLPPATSEGNRIVIFSSIMPLQLSTQRLESATAKQMVSLRSEAMKELQIEYENESSYKKWQNNGFTLLHYACMKGNIEVVMAQFKRGLHMLPRTTDACELNRTELCSSPTIGKGSLPLHVASLTGHVAIVTALLDMGASVDAVDSYGTTALYSACTGGRVDVVRVLLKDGAHVDAANCASWTALLSACENGRADIVKLLLSHDACVNVTGYNGWTPLLVASLAGNDNIAKQLLERGARVHSTTHGEWEAFAGKSSPLHLAAARGHCKVARLLLATGADVNLRNAKGNTPLDEARRGSKVFHLLSQCAENHSRNASTALPDE